jgi:sarcosine oxidase subunit gamma
VADPGGQSALAGHLRPGRHGVAEGATQLGLRELRPVAMAQLNAAPRGDDLRRRFAAFALDSEPAPLRCAAGDAGLRLLWTGPDRYLAVCARRRDEDPIASLAQALDGTDATLVDVSHARTVLRIEGVACRELLAKGCPLDLDAMGPGDCAPTLVAHFNVLLHCDGEHAFELYVGRSLAMSFLAWLLHAGDEFGVAVL